MAIQCPRNGKRAHPLGTGMFKNSQNEMSQLGNE